MTTLRDMDLQEVIREYADHTGHYCYEGELGVHRLGKLCKAIGYGNDYDYQDPLREFLADNSNAIYAMITWIGNQNNPNWKGKLVEFLLDNGFEDTGPEDE